MEAIKDIIKYERPYIPLLQEKKMSDVEVLVLTTLLDKQPGKHYKLQRGIRRNNNFFSRKYDIKNVKENQYWVLTEF